MIGLVDGNDVKGVSPKSLREVLASLKGDESLSPADFQRFVNSGELDASAKRAYTMLNAPMLISEGIVDKSLYPSNHLAYLDANLNFAQSRGSGDSLKGMGINGNDLREYALEFNRYFKQLGERSRTFGNWIADMEDTLSLRDDSIKANRDVLGDVETDSRKGTISGRVVTTNLSTLVNHAFPTTPVLIPLVPERLIGSLSHRPIDWQKRRVFSNRSPQVLGDVFQSEGGGLPPTYAVTPTITSVDYVLAAYSYSESLESMLTRRQNNNSLTRQAINEVMMRTLNKNLSEAFGHTVNTTNGFNTLDVLCSDFNWNVFKNSGAKTIQGVTQTATENLMNAQQIYTDKDNSALADKTNVELNIEHIDEAVMEFQNNAVNESDKGVWIVSSRVKRAIDKLFRDESTVTTEYGGEQYTETSQQIKKRDPSRRVTQMSGMDIIHSPLLDLAYSTLNVKDFATTTGSNVDPARTIYLVNKDRTFFEMTPMVTDVAQNVAYRNSWSYLWVMYLWIQSVTETLEPNVAIRGVGIPSSI